jgi:hypothetical protein
MAKIAEAEQLTTLEPKSGARPRVYYKNNHRFATIFVGGTVVTWNNGDEECVEGAGVTVWRGDKLVARASSDAFGEFKVGKIEPGAGPATLKIDVAGKPEKIVSIELCESAYIGCVEV